MLQSGLAAIFAGENRGVVAQAFWLPQARVYRVVISLVFLLCFQNDCINSAVGDSDIGSGVSVTVFCGLLFLFGLWPILFFVGTCRRVHLAFGLH